MLSLSYTAQKEDTLVSVSNRLMVSERQINDLLDTLVSNGYDILSTEITDGDYSPHWQGQSLSVPPARITPIRKQTERERNKMKIETAIWNGKKTKVLAVPSFSSSQEALDFLAEIQKLDKDATLTVTSVSQYN